MILYTVWFYLFPVKEPISIEKRVPLVVIPTKVRIPIAVAVIL
jgi:hypothetical protein